MIVVNVNVMLAKNKMTLGELSERLGITLANTSLLKTGKLKAIKLTTLDKLCKIFSCTPADLLEYKEDEHDPNDETV